jgi:hypothetical protein
MFFAMKLCVVCKVVKSKRAALQIDFNKQQGACYKYDSSQQILAIRFLSNSQRGNGAAGAQVELVHWIFSRGAGRGCVARGCFQSFLAGLEEVCSSPCVFLYGFGPDLEMVCCLLLIGIVY